MTAAVPAANGLADRAGSTMPFSVHAASAHRIVARGTTLRAPCRAAGPEPRAGIEVKFGSIEIMGAPTESRVRPADDAGGVTSGTAADPMRRTHGGAERGASAVIEPTREMVAVSEDGMTARPVRLTAAG